MVKMVVSGHVLVTILFKMFRATPCLFFNENRTN